MILKCLAAAGLAASLATGGALAVHTTPDSAPTATVTADKSDASGQDEAALDDHDGVEDHDGVDDTTTTTVTKVHSDPAATPTVSTFTAGDAGSVTLSVSGGKVTVAAVDPNAGWTVERAKGEGHEAKVTFRNGLHVVDFKAEFAAGQLKTRVRDRIEGADDDAPTVSTTPTTTDDDAVKDDDDDATEVEIEHSGDDHSGPGHDGSDDHSGRDDDDHSGSGHSGRG